MRSKEAAGGVGLMLLGVGLPALFQINRGWGGIIVLMGLLLLLSAFRGSPPLKLFVAYQRPKDGQEQVTFSLIGEKVTRLLLEPSGSNEARIVMDPREVLFLDPDKPVTCSILVADGLEKHSTVTSLVNFLENRKGGKIEVFVRFTNARGQRRRIPFNVEIMGTHHDVAWVPGTEREATPDW